MRIELQHGLDLGGQTVEAAAHVGDAAGQIDPNLPRRTDHDNADSTRRRTASSTLPVTRSFTPDGNSTSIALGMAGAAGIDAAGSAAIAGAGSAVSGVSATTLTGAKPVNSP